MAWWMEGKLCFHSRFSPQPDTLEQCPTCTFHLSRYNRAPAKLPSLFSSRQQACLPLCLGDFPLGVLSCFLSLCFFSPVIMELAILSLCLLFLLLEGEYGGFGYSPVGKSRVQSSLLELMSQEPILKLISPVQGTCHKP